MSLLASKNAAIKGTKDGFLSPKQLEEDLLLKQGIQALPTQNASNADAKANEHYEIPKILCPYKLCSPHPRAASLSNQSHEWLAGFGVDSQLGSRLWKGLVKQNTPDLMSSIYPNIEDKEFLFTCKYMLVLFALDTVLDESPLGRDKEGSLCLILEVITVLMWSCPEEPLLHECLPPLYNLVSSETSKSSVALFKSRLEQAKQLPIDACNLNLQPIASAWKDFWAEYLEYGLPRDHTVRLAQTLLQWLASCVEEFHYRSSHSAPGLDDYLLFRRKLSAVLPSVVVTDVIISRSPGSPPGLPNAYFYSPEMVRLLTAINDLVSWHNDIFSVYKECIVLKDKHNLVHILSDVHKCSYTNAAAEYGVKMLSDRIDDMESAIADLYKITPAEFHPAVDIYATTCRNWVSGGHEWHSKSDRYQSGNKA